MANGSLKKTLESSKFEKTFSLDDQEFNYIKNLENVKRTLVGAVELYINTAQIGFFQYLSSHKFGLDGSKKYTFDLDLEEDSDKKVKVTEN